MKFRRSGTLKFNHHAQTEEYLDMLHSNNTSPVITKPARITANHTATLIDHIYTNNTNQMISGIIATVDVADHLPTFCIADIPLQNKNLRNIRETTGDLIQNYTYRISKQLIGIVFTLKPKT